jgi:hypothetical protein
MDIVIKTAVSPLWHCKDTLQALKNQTWNLKKIKFKLPALNNKATD